MEFLEEIIGKKIVLVEGLEIDSEDVIFHLENGDKWKMYHDQCCCENVWLEDINGNVDNILNSEVLRFDEKCENDYEAEEDDMSGTYTFYTIATTKGYLDLRWHGTSNGNYSERVDFEKLKSNGEEK